VEREQTPHWRPTRGQALWSIRLAVGLAILSMIAAVVVAAVVGYATKSTEQATITGAFIGLFGILTTQVINAAVAWRTSQVDRERQLDLTEQNAQDDWLQAYLARMPDLLIDIQLHLSIPARPQGNELANATWPDAIRSRASRTVARAQTLAVLARVDATRQALILRYLYESGVIGKTAQEDDSASFLAGADLSRSLLSGMTLSRADLSGADLSGATVSRANLSGADLSWADLSGVNLSGALLDDATGVSNEELHQQAASLEGATMPNGQMYEEWLKDKEGRGEDGENDGPS
jgi:uncharacterized protein YjbI with pentapeptide repeats